MTDCCDADSPIAVGQLVKDAVGTDPEGVKTSQFSPECVTCKGIMLQKPKRILDRVDQRPAEIKQFTTGAPSQD